MGEKGSWLSITEYSAFKNISISTVRRYIKANRLTTKKEDGKYFIFVSQEKIEPKEIDTQKKIIKLNLEIERLKTEIRILKEEKNDLRMLVSIYESDQKSKDHGEELPDLPLT